MNILRTWHDNEVYNKEIEINFRDCDNNKKVKLSAVMGFASDIAGKDYTARGFSHDKMVEAKQVFILARYHFHFYKMPSVDDIITFRTWEKGIKDGYVLRDYEIIDSNNESCILASSTWLIINPDTRKIIKPRNFTLTDIGASEKILDCEHCDRIHFGEEKLVALGERIIYNTDLDANGHLNNANYANIAIDFLPGNLSDKILTDFYINYVREAKLKEVIKLFGYKECNDFYIIGKIENNLCFACKFVYI